VRLTTRECLPAKSPMLLVKTYIGKSAIHGFGVFAGEAIRKDTKVWRFVAGFDRVYSPSEFAKLPNPARDYISNYGDRVDGEILLTIDHDHHMNHSEDANTRWRNGYIVARRSIRKGEELTNDYREFEPGFCAAFLKKKRKSRRMPRVKAAPLPHRSAASGLRLSLGK